MTTTLDSLISHEGFISICKQYLYEYDFRYSRSKEQGKLYKDYSAFNSKVKEMSYGVFENEECTGVLVYEFWVRLKCGKSYMMDIPVSDILRYFKIHNSYRLFKESLPLLNKLIKGKIHQRELAPILFDLSSLYDFTKGLKSVEFSIEDRTSYIYKKCSDMLISLKKLK